MCLLFWEILLSLIVLVTSNTEVDPCQSYKELREFQRSQYYRLSGLEYAKCDSQLPTNWYRFRGRAGLGMPDYCIKTGSCGTHAPGWFQGTYPTVPGAVSSGRVCFSWWIKGCCYWYMDIKVKKCSDFYIYQLPETQGCDLYYCGDGAPDPECTADNNDISINGSVSGSLSSPNLTNVYPSSLQCTWRITAPAGMRVRLILKNVTFGTNDIIVFRDGLQNNSIELVKYTDCAAGELKLYSTGRYALVRFLYNGSDVVSGFRLDYEGVQSKSIEENTTTLPQCKKASIKPDPNCTSDNSDIRIDGSVPGSLSSPNLTGLYPSSLQCTWRITAPAGMRVRLILKNLTLGANNFMLFRDGPQDNSSQIVKYTDCAAGELKLYSTNRYALVGFVSNGSEAVSYFRLDYESVSSESIEENITSLPQCKAATNKPDRNCTVDNNDIRIDGSVPGSLSSPNLTGLYPSSLQCTWRITAPADMRVRLILKNVTFGANDFIEFRDGLQDNSSQIVKYADCAAGELKLYSTNRYALVRFVSNGSETASGFRLDYESVQSDETATALPECTRPTSQPVSPDEYAMAVKCDKDEINVVLHTNGPSSHYPRSVYLNDPTCKPIYQNSTHIFVKSRLGDCGTRSNVSKDGKWILYRNAVHIDSEKHQPIGSHVTRDQQMAFEFRCSYRRRTLVSAVSFNASKVVVINVASFGNFTFEMLMFKSGHFREYYTEYPIGPIDLDAEIFLEVSLRTNHAGLVLFLDECKATPTTDYDNEAEYFFIEDGCLRDNTVNYNYTLSSVQRFSLKTFNFRLLKSDEVYLHCQVTACLRSDLSSRCAQGCPYGRRRKRNTDKELEQYLGIGPIIVSTKDSDVHDETGSKKTRALHFNTSRVRKRSLGTGGLKRFKRDTTVWFVRCSEVSFGNFTFEMLMFKSGHFREYYTEYPIGPIVLDAEIFLEVSLRTSHAGLVLFLDECKATPTTDYDNEAEYFFIEDGCLKDNTVNYNYTLSSVQRFSLKTFNFRLLKSDEVYLHCQVTACQRSDLSSRCAQGCPYGRRRKWNTENEMEQYLAIGPIIVSTRKSDVHDKTVPSKSKEETFPFGLLAGGLAFLTIILLTAIVVILCKRRETLKPNGAVATILLRDYESGDG